MMKEKALEGDLADAEFKNTVFANNPKLYQELFEKEDEDEFEIEEIVPDSPEEVHRVLTEMRRHGILG